MNEARRKMRAMEVYGNSPVDLVVVQYYVFHYFQVCLLSSYGGNIDYE